MFFLQLRNELWKLFGKKRTYIGFAMFLLTQAGIAITFHFHKGPRGPTQQIARVMENNGYIPEEFLTFLTIAVAVLVPVSYILLPLYVSLVGGDLVAKEAEDGTLRMILSRPVSRLRLLALKWIAGAIFSYLLVLALGILGVVFTWPFFHSGGMFVWIPFENVFGAFGKTEAWERYALAHFFLGFKAVTIMSLAFMLSCMNIKPAAATIVAISFVLISKILQDIPYFSDLQEWFLTYHFNFWTLFLYPSIPWWKVIQSISILAGFNFTFFAVGATLFQLRDIKS